MGRQTKEFKRKLADGSISPAAYLLSPTKRVEIGQRFGYLTVIGAPFYLREDWDRNRRASVVCMCDCGIRTVVSTERLVSRRRVSCGECRNGEPRDPETDPAPDATEITFKQLAEQYVNARLITASKATVARFRRAFVRMYRHFGRDLAVAEITAEVLGQHFRWLMQDQKLTASSINSSHRAYLLSVWRYAMDEGLIDRIRPVPKLKELRHEPDSWDVGEVRRLVEATSILEGHEWPGVVPQDKYWRALILTAYWTGLRLGSLLKLRMADVDMTTGWIYVRPESAKNRHGKRLRVGADALQAIRDIASPARELLFPWPIATETIFRRFRDIQKAAGLPDSALKLQRFHKLRRTTATHAAIHGGLASAVALLDHAGPEVTKRYLDPSKMPGCDATAFLPALIDLGNKQPKTGNSP